MNILAIDPGLSGAAVALNDRGAILHISRDWKSLLEMSDSVEGLTEQSPIDLAVIELVSARPGQGVSSTFSFGRATGVALGALWASGSFPVIEVAPQAWQAYWRERYGPVPPLEVARQEMGPDYAGRYLARKKDHGTADAYLLGRYALSRAGTDKGIETSRKKDLETVGTAGRFRYVLIADNT